MFRKKVEKLSYSSNQAQMMIQSKLTAALATIDNMKEKELTMMRDMSEMRGEMKELQTKAMQRLVDVEESQAIRLRAETDATEIRYTVPRIVAAVVVVICGDACVCVCVCVCVCGGGGGLRVCVGGVGIEERDM
jgi:hypothetical protein